MDVSGLMHPRLRNDVIYLKVDSGAYLKSSAETCVIRGTGIYEWLAALVPLLDGSTSIAEICDGLDSGQTQLVEQLLGTLIDKGFARDLPATVNVEADLDYPSQRNYIEHFLDSGADAEAAFGVFRDARIVVLGASRAAESAVTALRSNGARRVVQVSAPESAEMVADCDVLIIDAASGAELAELKRISSSASLADHPLVIPVVRDAERALIGPVRPAYSEGPCWMCGQLRVSRNDRKAWSIGYRLAIGGEEHPADPSEVVLQMLGNQAAFVAFRELTGLAHRDSRRIVTVQNLLTLESSEHIVVPDPACPVCSGATTTARTMTPGELVSGDFGVFREWTDGQLDQIPVKVGRLGFSITAASGTPVRTEQLGFDLDDVLAARAVAIERAIARYAVERVGTLAPIGADGGEVIDVARILFARGDLISPDGILLAGESLVTGHAVAVERDAVRIEFDRSAFSYREPTLLGVGVGTDSEKADWQALTSAMTLQAIDDAVRGIYLAEHLALDGPGPEDLGFLLATIGRLGLEPRALVMPGSAPLSTVLVAVGEGPSTRWSVATSEDVSSALTDALLELVGRLAHDPDELTLGSRALRDLDTRVLFAGAGSAGLPRTASPPSKTDIADALRARQRDALIVDITPRDLAAVTELCVREAILIERT